MRLRRPLPWLPWPEEAADLVFRLLVVCTLCAGFYRCLWLDVDDPYKCKALRTSGHWLRPSHDHVPPLAWQPSGCVMHHYSADDMHACFKGVSDHAGPYFHQPVQFRGIGNPVFIGDSTVRELFWAVARRLDPTAAAVHRSSAPEHANINFTSHRYADLKLHFLWKPKLEDIASTRLWSDLNVTANSTEMTTEYARTSAHPFLPFYDSMIAGSSSWQPGQSYSLPKSLVVGVPGIWHARQEVNTSLDDFEREFNTITAFLERHVVIPIRTPRYSALSPGLASITPAKVEAMQNVLRTLPHTATVMWALNDMLLNHASAYASDGIHVVDSVTNIQADILLNTMCNAQLASLRVAAPIASIEVSDYSCCNDYTRTWNTGVAVTFIVIVSLLLGLQVVPGAHHVMNMPVLRAGSIIILTVILCMLTDRSSLFQKSNKSFRIEFFVLPCVAALVVGSLTIRKVPSLGSSSPSPEFNWLCRQQSEEWKGWMQIVILTIRYVGASEFLWAYQLTRVLVASYLFMTGYGHTLFFLRTKDFSVRRIGSVLLRTNLLVWVLAYAMGNNYLFYYFPGLVTFWFLVTYTSTRTLNGLEHLSKFSRLMVLILITIWTTAAFFYSTPALIFLSDILKINLYSAKLLREVFLDLYPTFFGTLCAIIVHNKAGFIISLYNVDNDFPSSIVMRRSIKCLNILCLSVLIAYLIGLSKFSTRDSFNTFHCFTSVVPIMAYVVLRNANTTMMNHYSAFFAWIGRCSLETYILQYHIWLAADSHGLLRLGLMMPWMETILFTVLFVWGSMQVGEAMKVVSRWIIEGGETLAVQVHEHDVESLEESPSKEKDVDRWPPFHQLTFPLVGAWKSSLRFRLGIILVTMWILNWLYDFRDLQRLLGFDFVAWKRHMIT